MKTKLIGIWLILWVSGAWGSELSLPSLHAESKLAHKELGDVRWHRDFAKAKAIAQTRGKPIFILFQEVPGCRTCVDYGRNVMRHPLMVEAIESEFVPLAIFNNHKGPDADVLALFNEPSWNNPVVRFTDANGKPIGSRVNGTYTLNGVAAAMVKTLERRKQQVPGYLQLLANQRNRGLERAVFAMHCFWPGEAALGKQVGVQQTRPGFLHGEEVVEVLYDPAQTRFSTLLKEARRHKCASRVFAQNTAQLKEARSAGAPVKMSTDKIRPDRAPKYYLSRTILRFLPMTEQQAGRINALVGQRKSPHQWLSPKQLALLAVIQKHPDAGWQSVIGQDIAPALQAASARARSL